MEQEEDVVMKSISFSIPGPPKGKGRPRFARAGKYVRTYTPKETANYENLVKLMYQEAAKGKAFGDKDMLDMRIIAYYQIPKSVSKRKRMQMLEHEIRPIGKPDTDNLMKSVADACNGVAYRDDAQIVDCQCRKFYSETPRVDVTIRRISPGEI